MTQVIPLTKKRSAPWLATANATCLNEGQVASFWHPNTAPNRFIYQAIQYDPLKKQPIRKQ